MQCSLRLVEIAVRADTPRDRGLELPAAADLDGLLPLLDGDLPVW